MVEMDTKDITYRDCLEAVMKIMLDTLDTHTDRIRHLSDRVHRIESSRRDVAR